MVVCLLKSCNPNRKPTLDWELMYTTIILFDYLNTIVILYAIYLCQIKIIVFGMAEDHLSLQHCGDMSQYQMKSYCDTPCEQLYSKVV